MADHVSIEEFLEQQRIPFSTFAHRPAFTAQEEAAASHVHGWNWAKTVVCMADGQPILAVLPAPYVIDFEQLRRVAGATVVRLASEKEMAALYPDCELGAMPPLGPMYHQRVFMDRRLADRAELVFDAGRHTKAIRMQYSDFVEVAQPVVAAFGAMRPAGSGRRPRPRVPVPPLF